MIDLLNKTEPNQECTGGLTLLLFRVASLSQRKCGNAFITLTLAFGIYRCIHAQIGA